MIKQIKNINFDFSNGLKAIEKARVFYTAPEFRLLFNANSNIMSRRNKTIYIYMRKEPAGHSLAQDAS
jgi:ABC-type branched-subunit amino acid transport system substrate-binding protein